MKTTSNSDQLRWHLQNNVLPPLNDKAIDGIIKTCEDFNDGKLTLSSPITSGTDCTVVEMFEDLKIEIE